MIGKTVARSVGDQLSGRIKEIAAKTSRVDWQAPDNYN
jgi:hypothetical protein